MLLQSSTVAKTDSAQGSVLDSEEGIRFRGKTVCSRDRKAFLRRSANKHE